LVVVDDLPWLEAKTHVLFQETTERWGSDVMNIPKAIVPAKRNSGSWGW
jgi:hypothetical protein